ncbi:MAG TPA: glycosyltransferase family 2 protein [Burkholderiales bacterium]|nr:glycosyltransferase family 2 protein [Burkholderiales bacterium]
MKGTQRERDRPLVCVLLPALNEANGLRALVPAVVARLLSLQVDYEVLIVDDGSVDDTALVVHDFAQRRLHVRYLRLSRNFGKEAAISAGLARARGDAIVIMDADGQHPVELLDCFVAHWRAGRQIVYGVQRVRDESWLKRQLKACYYAVLRRGAALDIPLHAGDFRLLDRRVVDALNTLPERNRYMKGLYAWVGFDAVGVVFDALPRIGSRSRFDWLRLLHLGLTGFTAFSVVPLRLISMAGLLVSTAAFVYGSYVVIKHLLVGTDVPGWPTVVAGMMLLSGVQLLSLGILGEYLGRVFDEVKQRPLYIVAEEFDAASPRSDSGEMSHRTAAMSTANPRV